MDKAIKIYDKQLNERSVNQILGEANCGLSHLCLKMGEWLKGEDYLHEAERLLEEEEIVVSFGQISAFANS